MILRPKLIDLVPQLDKGGVKQLQDGPSYRYLIENARIYKP